MSQTTSNYGGVALQTLVITPNHSQPFQLSSSDSSVQPTMVSQPPPPPPPQAAAKRIHREVRFGNYILGSTLGEGEFGKVKLGWRKDGKLPSQVAIKLIKRESIARDPDSEIKVHREINSLKLLNHPNIVNLVEVMKSGKYIGIVLEFASGGELFDYILQHKYLKENVAKRIFAQLISGVDYMHSKGLIHRDLKLENLLLDKHKNVIISDFGFVNSYNKEKNDLMKTSCGSPCYAAPELVLTQSPYEGRKVDIWSLGVILYAMLSGYLPFDDDPDNIDGADIVKLYHYICKTPLTFPEYVSPLARDLLRKIIVPDPKHRINMDEIRNHAWLTPHVNLLSIRQPEWDRIHKENMTPMFTSMNSQNKRYSMIPERTTSVSLVPGRGRSSSSSNVVNQFYITPVPTTQRSLANAVAVNSNSSTSHLSTSPNSASNYPVLPPNESSNPSSRKSSPTSTKQVHRGHTKSASMSGTYPSASTALKAVVSENDYKRNSVTSLNSITSLNQNSSSKHSVPTTPSVSRSNTFVGSSVISTIAESPSAVEKKTDSINIKLESDKPFIALLPSNVNREKLPHAEKKPRPTSYHPSSLTSTFFSNSANGSSSGLLEYMNLQILTGSPPKTATSTDHQDCLPFNELPTSQTASKHSRRNSVITPVHVNGVLTSEVPSHDNRNAVLNYLEDKMDTLELTDLHSPVKLSFVITPEINQVPNFDSQYPIIAKNNHLETPKPMMENSKGNSSKETFKSSEVPSAPTLYSSRSEKLQLTESVVKEKLNKREKVKDDDKENRDIKEQKKKNRFSILSFYSTYSASSNTLSNLQGDSNHKSSSSSSGKKKVLAQSSNANIMPPAGLKVKEKKRDASNGSSNSTRSTSPSNSSVNTGAKEASAARKVLDFFKRRSVRIG